jgi:hypothetical protein
MGTIDKLMAFENGDLSEVEIVELFQHLVNTGVAWQLQGFYGRTAARLIEAGLVTPKRTPVTLREVK